MMRVRYILSLFVSLGLSILFHPMSSNAILWRYAIFVTGFTMMFFITSIFILFTLDKISNSVNPPIFDSLKEDAKFRREFKKEMED